MNPHNSSTISIYDDNIKSLDYISVGNFTYGEIKPFIFNDQNYLKIGHFCSIAPNVCFVLSGDHHFNTLSSFPFYAKCIDGRQEATSKGDIIIEDDVWIGVNSIILSGVKIGRGAVIGAGSVVSKDIPPYAIACGNPAKIIKYRFDEKIIKELMTIDYSKLTSEKIHQNIKNLYEEINNDNVLDIINELELR